MANNVASIKARPQISNPMDEARASAERAATEYNKMHSDLLAFKAANEELRGDNDLLRAEVARTVQRYEELKGESEFRIKEIENERDQYMRFGVQVSAQLAFIEKMHRGNSDTISSAIANAIEASKKFAFEKPELNEEQNGKLKNVADQIEGDHQT